MTEVEVERECRICRGEDEPDRPLLHPCRCSGSIKYTHEDCLVNWLAQSGSSRCELCNHSFRFEPVYQPNTPSALPTKEFVVGVLALTKRTLKTAARIILVFSVWLFFLPVGTCWTWYALFINSPSQLPALLALRGLYGVITDAFYGLLLSTGIVFVFLGVSSLREYVRHFPHDPVDVIGEPAFDAFRNEDNIVQDDFDGFDSEHDENHRPLMDEYNRDVGNGDLLADHPEEGESVSSNEEALGPNDQTFLELPPDDHNGYLNMFDEVVQDTLDEIGGSEESDDDIAEEHGTLEEHCEEGGGLHLGVRIRESEQNPDIDFPANDSDTEYDASGSDYMEDDEYDNPHANEQEPLHGMQEDNPLLQHDAPNVGEENDPDGRGDGGALFGLFELDPDEVPLEEVVGLRGHIRNLFDNAGTVLISNAIFLGVFTLIPLLIGRLTLRLFAMKSFPVQVKIFIYDYSSHSFVSRFSRAAEVIGLDGGIASNLSSPTPIESSAASISDSLANGAIRFGKHMVSMPTGSASSEIVDANKSVLATGPTNFNQPLVSYVDNFLIVLLGYGMIALIAVGYIGVMSMLRQRYPRLDSPITRQVARMLRYVATFVKIVVLILFEFGIFPLGCGWWLDICTLDLFGGTLESRLSYCNESPWICTAGHWLMGIVYMVHISLFVSLLREVVKPELLWFLRNPDDPEFHPFRELVEKPLSRHARRMCLSVIIYVPLIIALVFLPGQLCLHVLPKVFPFRSEDFSHILIDVPFGNLLIGPLIRILYFGRPEVSLQKLVSIWIRWVSSVLGIKDLVVKDERDPANERQGHEHARREPANIPGFQREDHGPLDRMLGVHNDDVHDGIEWPDPVDEDMDMEVDETELLTNAPEEIPRSYVRMRAVTMILCAWLTLILVESALLAIPTVLGRSLMSAVSLPVRHDLHPFLLGLNVLLGSISAIFKIVKYIQTVNTVTVLSLGLPYLYLAGKGFLIMSAWLGVIPLAAGLLFELILVPIRVSFDETPYFCLHQDWALGLLLLKVWACIAMTGGLGAKWRERVMRAREGDIIRLDQNFARTMREIVIPVLISVITALSLPYSIARGVLPMLGVARWVSNVVYRYAYLIITCLYCGFETLRYLVSVLRDLHDSIRDDKYLVGKRLYNFVEIPDGTSTG